MYFKKGWGGLYIRMPSSLIHSVDDKVSMCLNMSLQNPCQPVNHLDRVIFGNHRTHTCLLSLIFFKVKFHAQCYSVQWIGLYHIRWLLPSWCLSVINWFTHPMQGSLPPSLTLEDGVIWEGWINRVAKFVKISHVGWINCISMAKKCRRLDRNPSAHVIHGWYLSIDCGLLQTCFGV